MIHGSWPSPISAELAAAGGLRISDLQLCSGDALWVEGRPAEMGRCAVVRARQGAVEDLLDPPGSARTAVHEYGGGAMTAGPGAVYFSNAADRRLYRITDGAAPEPLTPDLGDVRYADMEVDATRRRLICVVEDHRGARVVNDIRAIGLEGGEPESVVAGNDFYSNPRISPDGTRIAWLTWNQPNMPWDGCQLWVARLDESGTPRDPTLVAGGARESIFQPTWSPGSVLHFSSDRTGWWNLYRVDRGAVVPMAPMEAECARPQWQFRLSTFAFADESRIVMWVCRDGNWELLLLHTGAGSVERLDLPYNSFGGYVDAAGDQIVFLAGGPRQPQSVVRLDLTTGSQHILRCSSDLEIPDAVCSAPRHISFPGHAGATAHAWYYAPRNDMVEATEGLPPLLVAAHGGPTSATSAALSPSVQFWTSRGFAVVDVDYGGSTGYGRPYRERLNGESGIVDVGDCVAVAQHLAGKGTVDSSRMMIHGGSAGGYIVLCAMTFHDVFGAGASLYGIADIEALIADTHKFEARYEAPYPNGDGLRARSPVHFIDRVRHAVLLLQGEDDPVVPASQSEAMYAALREAGVPCAYIAFPGEQHGFRQAANIRRTLEAELYFFARVLGFDIADNVEPVPIANLDGPARV